MTLVVKHNHLFKIQYTWWLNVEGIIKDDSCVLTAGQPVFERGSIKSFHHLAGFLF